MIWYQECTNFMFSVVNTHRHIFRWPGACPRCSMGDMVAIPRGELSTCTCDECGYQELLNVDEFWWAKQALPAEW